MRVRRKLMARAPYDLRLIRRGYLFAPWRFEHGRAVRTLLSPTGHVVEAQLAQSGSINRPKIQVLLSSATDLSSGDVSSLCAQLDCILGLTEDLSAFYRIAKNDPVLSRAMMELKGYRVKTTADLHEMLISAVVSQNTTFHSFRRMLMTLVERFGSSIFLDGGKVCAFPSAQALAKSSRKALERTAAYRAQAIQNVSRAILNGLEGQIEGCTTDQATERLMSIKGLGPYSALAAILYGLRHYEVFFIDTYVLKVMGNLFFEGKKPNESKLRDFAAQRWGAWQGLALDLLLAWQMEDHDL
jgi:DNA-3-methyladenine glycosylase II